MHFVRRRLSDESCLGWPAWNVFTSEEHQSGALSNWSPLDSPNGAEHGQTDPQRPCYRPGCLIHFIMAQGAAAQPASGQQVPLMDRPSEILR
jgi:hypothetical protein